MNVVAQRGWTAEQFLDWAGCQDTQFEFDGVRPVAMMGGNAGRSRAMLDIHEALRSRLRGTGCSSLEPDLGVRTVGEFYEDVASDKSDNS